MDKTNEESKEERAFDSYKNGIEAEKYGNLKEALDCYTLAMIIDKSKNQLYIDAVKRIETINSERHKKIKNHMQQSNRNSVKHF